VYCIESYRGPSKRRQLLLAIYSSRKVPTTMWRVKRRSTHLILYLEGDYGCDLSQARARDFRDHLAQFPRIDQMEQGGTRGGGLALRKLLKLHHGVAKISGLRKIARAPPTKLLGPLESSKMRSGDRTKTTNLYGTLS